MTDFIVEKAGRRVHYYVDDGVHAAVYMRVEGTLATTQESPMVEAETRQLQAMLG